MDLDLKIVARVTFAIDGEDACLCCLDTVCIDFKGVLLRGGISEGKG